MRTHARIRRSVVVVLLALVLAACGQGPSGDAVATVNDTEISSDLFERLVTAQVNNPASPLADVSGEQRVTQIANLQRQVLTQLIRTAILDQAAREQGVEVSDEQLQERYEQEEAFRGSPEAFQQRIAELGYTDVEARALLRSVLMQEGFETAFTSEIEITEDELRAYYEDRKPFEYELADVRHILVDTEEEAEEILALLEAGGDFAQLAEERSTDSVSAAQGGSLGRAPKGSYVEEFDDAVWAAEVGELVGPVQTQFGFHILRVDEFVDVSFDEARDEIEGVLRGRAGQEQLNAYVQSLFESAEVEIDSRIGRWDPATGQVVDDDPLS